MIQVKKAREEWNVGTEAQKFEASSGHTCTQAFNSEKSSMFLAQHYPHPLRVQCPAPVLCQNMRGTAFNTEHPAAALAAQWHQKNHHCIRELRPCLLPLASLCFMGFLQCWKRFSCQVECHCAQDCDSQWQEPLPGKEMVLDCNTVMQNRTENLNFLQLGQDF